MSRPPKMVTLLPSTDVDLGRWLMQIWGQDYRESPHAPVFHVLALRWHGAGRQDAPLLLGNPNIATVEALVSHFDPLAPPECRVLPERDDFALRAEVLALQEEARWVMGSAVVNWAYYHFLRHRDLVWPSLTTGIPWFEVAALRAGGYGRMRRIMTDALGLGAEDAEGALSAIRRHWDAMDARLSDGREYLAGDRLTLADLAFATAGAPMVLARGYGGHLPGLADCPPEIARVVAEMRDRPAGRFVQTIYDRHRR